MIFVKLISGEIAMGQLSNDGFILEKAVNLQFNLQKQSLALVPMFVPFSVDLVDIPMSSVMCKLQIDETNEMHRDIIKTYNQLVKPSDILVATTEEAEKYANVIKMSNRLR